MKIDRYIIRDIIIVLIVLALIATGVLRLKKYRDEKRALASEYTEVYIDEEELEEKKTTEDEKTTEKEITIEEIEREIEKAKSKFNLTIQTGKIPADKPYSELEDAPLEKVISTLKPTEEIFNKTIELTNEDIKRLQEYKQIKLGGYESFEDYDNDEALIWIDVLKPDSFPTYTNAKVEWLTDHDLVYRNILGETAIRGILRLQYFRDENRFKLKANKIYEIDTEIVISNTVNKDMSISTKLNEITYLSNFKEVK